jgi:hypothetical protein
VFNLEQRIIDLDRYRADIIGIVGRIIASSPEGPLVEVAVDTGLRVIADSKQSYQAVGKIVGCNQICSLVYVYPFFWSTIYIFGS